MAQLLSPGGRLPTKNGEDDTVRRIGLHPPPARTRDLQYRRPSLLSPAVAAVRPWAREKVERCRNASAPSSEHSGQKTPAWHPPDWYERCGRTVDRKRQSAASPVPAPVADQSRESRRNRPCRRRDRS